MPTPIFQVYESGGTTVATSHSFGQVKAGNDSAVYTVEVWNNKGGSSPVSDVIEATVTVTDASGGNTVDVVTGKYMNVNVNGETASGGSTLVWTAIGGTSKAPIRAAAYTSASDSGGGGKFDGTVPAGTTAATATANCGIMQFKIVLPNNATSGKKTGKIRFEGYYV